MRLNDPFIFGSLSQAPFPVDWAGARACSEPTVADKQRQLKKKINPHLRKPSESIETHLRSFQAKFQYILSSCSRLNYHLRNLYLEILAEPLKNYVKSWKIAQSLSFLKSGTVPKFGEFLLNRSSPKKSSSFPILAMIHQLLSTGKIINVVWLGCKQDNFSNQVSMLETKEAGHECKITSLKW